MKKPKETMWISQYLVVIDVDDLKLLISIKNILDGGATILLFYVDWLHYSSKLDLDGFVLDCKKEKIFWKISKSA